MCPPPGLADAMRQAGGRSLKFDRQVVDDAPGERSIRNLDRQEVKIYWRIYSSQWDHGSGAVYPRGCQHARDVSQAGFVRLKDRYDVSVVRTEASLSELCKLVQSLVGVGAESCIAAPNLGHAFGKPSG